MANPIGNLGTIPTLTVGGAVFTDLTNLIRLYGNTNNNNATLRVAGSSSGYAVTGGMTLTVHVIETRAASTTSCDTRFLYSDNDMGISSATSPTNPVYLTGSSGQPSQSGSQTIGVGVFDYPKWGIPATKYTGYVSATNTTVYMRAYGYEA